MMLVVGAPTVVSVVWGSVIWFELSAPGRTTFFGSFYALWNYYQVAVCTCVLDSRCLFTGHLLVCRGHGVRKLYIDCAPRE
jgi:hypothetical protein